MEEYQTFLYNEEFENYTKYLKNINFEDKLKALSGKYKGKKVLIYGNGIFFEVICKNYDIKKYLDICAISDIRYEKTEEKEYLGFSTIKPNEIYNSCADVILITTINPNAIKNFLLKNNFVKKSVIIKPLIQNSFADRLKKVCEKFQYAKQYMLITKKIFRSIKYFFVLNETEYKSKINYVKVINRLKKDKNKKLRVAFLCEENAKWGYQSIYDEMLKDENFEILPIITLPIITALRHDFTQEKNIEFFKSFQIDAADGFDYAKNVYKPLEEFKPDIVFYQQPWYVVTSQLPQEVSKYALTCIVSYGYTSIDTKSWGSDAVSDFSGNLWHMFAESDYHKQFYQKAAKLRHKDIIITKGYPKLDNYNYPIDTRFESMWNGGNHSGRIIWAPHHTIDRYGLAMSGFKEQYLFFLEFAKKHTEYSFIFKPHPALKYKCIAEKFLTEDEYDNYIEQWNSLHNAVVYNEGNYFDIFKTSDVLITDSSSFLAEYFYSQKPIIFYEKESRAGFNAFGQKIKKGFYVIRDINEIESILDKILIKKEDNLLSLRKKIINKEFYFPKEGVGKNIVKFLKTETGRL